MISAVNRLQRLNGNRTKKKEKRMKKLYTVVVGLILLLAQNFASFAQADSSIGRYTIAVFAPLYLDSAFDAINEYQYGKSFPKFLNPGLEFYEGVQLAADSLNRTGAPLDIYIYDTRSVNNPISTVFLKPEFNKVNLIIGHVSNNEIRTFAEVARKKNIPFINAMVPNDAGITNNPSLVLLNSTLRTRNIIGKGDEFQLEGRSRSAALYFGKIFFQYIFLQAFPCKKDDSRFRIVFFEETYRCPGSACAR